MAPCAQPASRSLRVAVAAAVTLALAVASAGQEICPGDCDVDGTVTADEIEVVAAAIFDPSVLEACLAADTGGSGVVVAAALVAAVLALAAEPGECFATPASMWIARAPLAGGPRQEVGVAALGETIYVIGGFGGPERVEAYDPVSNDWSRVANLPSGRNHVGAGAAGGHVYAIGGFAGVGFSAVADVFRYDPSADRWDPVEPLPTARGALAVAEIDGKLYAVGGEARSVSVTRHDVYDPSTDSWTELAPLPTARNHLAAAAIDGDLYVVGGRTVGLISVAELNRYDAATNSWAVLAPMPTARSGHAAVAFEGRLVVMGGEVNPAHPQGVFPEVEVYEPATDRWIMLRPMAVPRHGIGAVTVDDLIYVPGGATLAGFGATAHHDALRIDF